MHGIYVKITEEYNFMVISGELISTIEYVTLQTRCRINRCRYKRVRLYTLFSLSRDTSPHSCQPSI
jgi:hypothetical protein